MSDKNNPSDLYDEEFLKKKEEFYSGIEGMRADLSSAQEDDGSFESLIDDFADSDLVSKLSSKKDKKEKKRFGKKKKKDSFVVTPEPEYDIFDLGEDFGIKDKKKNEKTKDKKKKKVQQKKVAPQKPREPLKPFVPHTPVAPVQADVYVKDEKLYEEQNVDIDELLKNLGIPTAEEIEQAEAEEKSAEAKAENGEGKAEMEDISSVSEDMPSLDEEVKEYAPNKENDGADDELSHTKYFNIEAEVKESADSGATRYFNLKNYIRSQGSNSQENLKKKAGFTQHFRFLKNKESDETILEAVPTGKGKDSMMDSVRAAEGEDIFSAVEKAQRKKKRSRVNTTQSFISLKDYDEKLTGKIKVNKKKLITAAVAFVISAVLTVPFSAYGLKGAHHGLIYSLVNLLAVALIGVIAKSELVLGFNNIRYLSPDQNSVTFISGAFVVLFNILTMLTGNLGADGVMPYTVCFAFVVLVRFAGAYLDDIAAQKSVKALSEKGEYEGVHYVSGKNDALVIAHGLSENKVPTVLYSSESRVDSGIREDKAPKKDEDKFYSFTSIAVLMVGFVAGIILMTRNRDAVSFIRPLVACVSLGLPVMNELISSLLFYGSALRLSEKGASVNDTESLEILSQAKAVSLDARELFTCEVSSFRKVRGSHISKSDAAVFAAATLKAGGSMVGECFDEFIESLGFELPEASDIQYEEKLGFSCWIADRRVLVGNRQMLVEHSIEAPTQAEEKAYAGKKNVMYVAVEGMLVASFLVKYKAVPSFRKIAEDFEKTGFVLLVCSKEPCLDEENCAARLSLDVVAVKILSQKATSLVNSYREDSEKGRALSLICLKKKYSLTELVVSAHRLYHSDRLASILLVCGQAVALVLILLSVILNMPIFYNPVIIAVLQVLWALLCYTVVSAEFRKAIIKKIVNLIAKGRKDK